MPNETTITQIENILSQIVDIGGQQEITSIVTNLEVVDANPAGLTNFVTIKDERDGDTILAKKVPGVGYAVADLVNVLFINGTEPVAFQQASQSSGDPVLVSKLVSPDETINPVISADNTGNVTIAGTGDLLLSDKIIHDGDIDTGIDFGTTDQLTLVAGGIDMLQLVEDPVQDEIVLGDGSDIDLDLNGDIFIRGSDGFVGIGNAVPQELLHVGAGTDASSIGSTIIYATSAGTATVSARDSTNDVEVFMLATAGLGLFGTFTDTDFELRTNNTARLFIESTGEIGIGTSSPLARLHVDQPSTTAAIPVLLLDQADVDEPFTKYIGTAAVATLTRSIVAEADVTTATRQGFYKIEIEDIGNQVTDQDYFVPFYTLA